MAVELYEDLWSARKRLCGEDDNVSTTTKSLPEKDKKQKNKVVKTGKKEATNNNHVYCGS